MIKSSHHPHWKSLILGALALGANPWLACADYATEVTSRNPIAYYRLNEAISTSGTAVNSGSLGALGDGAYGSHVAHPTGGALPSQTANGAASFFAPTEGSVAANSRIAVPFHADLNAAGPFTVEFWAKPIGTSSGCPMSSIVLGNSGWLFYNSALTAGRWSFRTINSASGNVNATGGTVTVGAWQHVAGVWDGTQIILYVNGVPVATNTSATFKPVTDTATAFTIGVRSDNGFNFKGSLDEPAYYAGALSAAQILAHYQAGTNPTPATAYDVVVGNDAPAGYWGLNDGTMAVNTRTRGLAANGGYIGSTTTGDGPRPATQPGFEAGNNAATLTSASASWVGLGAGASLTGTTDFSVSAWVKTIATTEGVIVQQRDASPGGYAANIASS